MAIHFLLLLVSIPGCYTANLADEYDHYAILDHDIKKYQLYWGVDREKRTVSFAVEVQTTGWIGLGFSSQSGRMKGSDLVIGWVKNCKGYLTDRYADGYSVPVLDKQQDFELSGFSEKDGKTVLKFKRKFDTCDECDRKLEDGTVTLIYAYNDEDPRTEMDLQKHTFKGQRTLMLLNTFKMTLSAKTLKFFDVRNKQVHVPGKPTTYWCQPIKLPHFKEKRHVVRIAPIIDKGHQGLVHHMVIYICDDDFDDAALGKANECFHPQLPKAIDKCGLKPVLMAWAMGVTDFVYPEHVGFSVGTKHDPKYLLLSTHFNNHGNKTDFVDSSGMRFYYDTPRQYDAGVLMAGCMIKSSIVIPPKQREWITDCYCPSQCTRKGLSHTQIKGGGIKVFAVALHTHSAGRRVRTRHVRNGEELPDIVHNNNFDMKHQDILYLGKEVQVLPGDDIIPECVYNTMDRTTITKGGHGATDEMCLNFIMYYPQSNLTLCLMESDVTNRWSKRHVKGRDKPAEQLPFEWNNSMAEELRAEYETEPYIKTYCMGGRSKWLPGLEKATVPKPRVMLHLPKKPESCKDNAEAKAIDPASTFVRL